VELVTGSEREHILSLEIDAPNAFAAGERMI
jgi:hypothetical protein